MALTSIASVALVIASAALLYTWRVVFVYNHRITALEMLPEDVPDSVWKRDMEHMLRLMDERITEGIAHAKRREERSRGVVRGALKRMDAAGLDDPALEAEAEELGVGDAEDGAGTWLPPLPDVVASGPVLDEVSPIPGLTMAEYQTLLGEGAG